MGTVIVSEDTLFEWDMKKNENNIKKHGFGFDEITEIFKDPYLLTRYDDIHSQEEQRFYSIGCLNGVLIIVVYHTERNNRVRIISARRAEKKLQEVYYDYVKKVNG